MNAERVEQFRAERRAAVLATVLGQRRRSTGRRADAPAISNEVGDAYFAGSARRAVGVFLSTATRERAAASSERGAGRSCDVYELLCS